MSCPALASGSPPFTPNCLPEGLGRRTASRGSRVAGVPVWACAMLRTCVCHPAFLSVRQVRPASTRRPSTRPQ
eukprot:2394243-Alexandrium_andersonii.AAC.1